MVYSTRLETVEGDGGPAKVTDETLGDLKEAVNDICSETTTYVVERRQNAENTRYCIWNGQSPDGRKRKEYLDKDPLPFEGASDNRVRLADKLINIFVKQCVTAARRAEPRVTGTEGGDISTAGKVGTILRYVVNNLWRADYRKQLEKLANYMFGDSPAGAVAFVDWNYEEGLEYRTISAEDVMVELINAAMERAEDRGMSGDPELVPQIIQTAQALIEDESQAGELAVALQTILPDVSPARLKKVAKDLQTDYEAQYPARYVKNNKPVFKAMRLFDDVFFRVNTTDFQRASEIFTREWLTKSEVLERAAVNSWSDEFVDSLLYGGDGGHKDSIGAQGRSGFDDYLVNGPLRDELTSTEDRKGLYEILTGYTRAANDDGVTGIYVYTFSYFCDVAAKDRELWDRKHGLYPFIYFQRENITDRLMDSRGVSELAMSDQAGMKLLKDSFEDHVQVTINPPIVRPRNRPFFNLNRAPFGQIEADSRDRVEFLEPNQYPIAADKYWREMRRDVYEYWGIYDPEVNPNEVIVGIMDQDRIDNFLMGVSDILAMTVKLSQQYFDDETIQRIVGGGGLPVARTVEEIQGSFDIHCTFDARDFDTDKLVKKADIVLKSLRPLDTKGIIPYDHFLRQIVASLDPQWAELIPTSEASGQRISREEQDNMVKMLNGVEPEMNETVEAPALRLQVLQQGLQPRFENPAAYPPISTASQIIIENRIKYLTFQAQQLENASVGRLGTEPVTNEQLTGQEGAQ